MKLSIVGSFIDMAGKRFGRLVVSRDGGRNKHGTAMWWCRCACANVVRVSGSALRNGKTTSCGCYHREVVATITGMRSIVHGESVGGRTSREYRAWSGLKGRCENPRDKAYASYGGRGIRVCRRWRRFQNFLGDMGRCPGKGYSIDRKNNDKGYSKSNCHWTTRVVQARNRRSNKMLTCDGVTLTRAEWAERKGMSQTVLQYRIDAGWSVRDALYRSVRPHNVSR